MREFGSYLRSRMGTIILCLITAAAFASAYLLFELPLITVAYPLVLGSAAGAVAVVTGFMRFRRRRQALASEMLPEPADLIEEDYQNIISKMQEDAKRAREQSSQDYRDMLEYYTVWAHQIKTPMAAMRLQLQSEDSESARKLGGDLNRIEGYVEMVLAYLRLDSASSDYVIGDHDIDEIIKPAIRKFSREFILKKLTLDYEPVNMTALTDDKWLTFVIEQVISNAVKYTDEGGQIRIFGSDGRVFIEDNGAGINPEDLPRIFEKGYTGFNGRQDKKASGIGLYLCSRIMKNLGHGITAESTAGEGTVIALDLRRGKLEVE